MKAFQIQEGSLWHNPTLECILFFCETKVRTTRYKEESKSQAATQAELDKANERFKEYERKDIKLREDLKHLKAKLKKLGDKLTKDTAKAEVCHLSPSNTTPQC